MSSDSTTSSATMLSVYTIAQWKSELITKALDLNALDILNDKESPPDPSGDARLVADYRLRKSKLAGYIRGTLDEVQLTTVLGDIKITDIPAVYKALLKAYHPKTAAS